MSEEEVRMAIQIGSQFLQRSNGVNGSKVTYLRVLLVSAGKLSSSEAVL